MAMIEQLFAGLRREPVVLRIDLKCKLKRLPVQKLLIVVDVIPQSENLLLTMGDMVQVQSREMIVLGL